MYKLPMSFRSSEAGTSLIGVVATASALAGDTVLYCTPFNLSLGGTLIISGRSYTVTHNLSAGIRLWPKLEYDVPINSRCFFIARSAPAITAVMEAADPLEDCSFILDGPQGYGSQTITYKDLVGSWPPNIASQSVMIGAMPYGIAAIAGNTITLNRRLAYDYPDGVYCYVTKKQVLRVSSSAEIPANSIFVCGSNVSVILAYASNRITIDTPGLIEAISNLDIATSYPKT